MDRKKPALSPDLSLNATVVVILSEVLVYLQQPRQKAGITSLDFTSQKWSKPPNGCAINWHCPYRFVNWLQCAEIHEFTEIKLSNCFGPQLVRHLHVPCVGLSDLSAQQQGNKTHMCHRGCHNTAVWDFDTTLVWKLIPLSVNAAERIITAAEILNAHLEKKKLLMSQQLWVVNLIFFHTCGAFDTIRCGDLKIP